MIYIQMHEGVWKRHDEKTPFGILLNSVMKYLL